MRNEQLINTIRHLRYLNQEMTQQDLANRCGVSRQTIHAIEKGTFNPSVKLAIKIARIFDCKVEDVFQMQSDL